MELPSVATRLAFEASDYRVSDGDGGIVLAVGPAAAGRDHWLVRHGCRSATVLTAWNPLAIVAMAATNRAAHRRLAAAVASAGLTALASCNEARDGGWPGEEGLCILDLDLARLDDWLVRFRQYAALRVEVARPGHLVWHPAIRGRLA